MRTAQNASLSVLSIMLLNSLHASATTVLDARLNQYVEDLRAQIYKNWEPLQFGPNVHGKVQFKIYATGRIADVKLIDTTGNAQADSCCLDAVEQLEPFTPMEAYGLDENELTTFYIFQQPDEKHNFHCDKYSKDGCLVFHSVPLEVLTRYPDQFKELELHEPKNVRLYDPTHHSQYWTLQLEWAIWFRTHKKASRAQITSERDWLDGKFEFRKVGESTTSGIEKKQR